MSEPLYRSGSDVELEHAGLRYRFASADLTARVRVAASELGLAPRGSLDELFVTGIADPSLGVPEERIEETVYWLRKLVFRAAWRDVRVAAGLLETTFDERSGAFLHRYDGHELPISSQPPPAHLRSPTGRPAPP